MFGAGNFKYGETAGGFETLPYRGTKRRKK
jgi:hypothetical protein